MVGESSQGSMNERLEQRKREEEKTKMKMKS